MTGPDPIARALFDAVRPSRVTVRGVAPGGTGTTYLHAEVLAAGVPSMAGAPQDGITVAPTYRWLQEHRTVLVQHDCREDPLPPRMLTGTFQVAAQLLGPLLRGGELVGTISVHQQGAPRRWSEADVRALGDAVDRLGVLWDLDRHT